MDDKDKLSNVGSLPEPTPAGERIVNSGISLNHQASSVEWVERAQSEMTKFVDAHILPVKGDDAI